MSQSVTKQIEKILEEEGRIAKEALDFAAEKVSKETVKELRSTSPKRTGKYARSWRATKQPSRTTGTKYVIHSVKHYRLTHLLEKGHALRQGGRTRAFPHIGPAEKAAIENFERTILAEIRKG